MFERIQHLSAKSFKRKCGVKRETFDKMIEVLKPKLTRKGNGVDRVSLEWKTNC